MKYKIKHTIVLALGLIAMLSSCQRDLLTPQVQTGIADVNAFSTPTRIANQVLSLYASMKSANYYGGRYQVYGDIRGEDWINYTTNLVTNSDVWALNPTNSANAVVGLWAAAYSTINACNLFIDGMNAGGTAVVGTTLANNYIGEAKLVRGLAYYSLLQYYARPFTDGNGNKPGVPMRLTGIKGPGFSALARSTVADGYTQIIKDLDSAELILPLSYSTDYNNTTRAHRNTAIALKTRVYLSMGNYAKVITEANKIVNASAPFAASTGVANTLNSDFTKIFLTPYTTKESIMSMPMSVNDYTGSQSALANYFYNNGSVGSAEFYLNPAGIIANAGWGATDIRRSLIYTGPSGRKYYSKYATPSPYVDYAPVIRYSEVMLSLAEAIARSTNTVDPQAVALLNAVRKRSDATVTFTVASFATPAALISAILTERQIEFLAEGIHNLDQMRLLQTIPAKGSVAAKAPSENGYIWPISANELNLNPLMTDN
jgi:HAMP domain-containing protein